MFCVFYLLQIHRLLGVRFFWEMRDSVKMLNFKLLLLKETTKTYALIEVACAVIIRDNKFLVTQRREKVALPLKSEFTGENLKLINHLKIV